MKVQCRGRCDFLVLTLNTFSLPSHGHVATTWEIQWIYWELFFPGHLISPLDDIPWPPRSLILWLPDMFFSADTWKRALRSRPQSIDGLKNRTSQKQSRKLTEIHTCCSVCDEQFSSKITRNSKTPWRTFYWCQFYKTVTEKIELFNCYFCAV
jgi:hypothetical protein